MLAAMLPLCLVPSGCSCRGLVGPVFQGGAELHGHPDPSADARGVLGTIYPIDNRPWMFGVPMLGQYVLLTNVLGGRAPGPLAFVAAAAACAVAAALLMRVTVSLFRSERIIFGR